MTRSMRWMAVAIALIVVATTLSTIALRPRADASVANEFVVRIDPRTVSVRPVVLAKGGERFADAISHLKPYAAINGTFYDKDYKPLGDIVADGKLINKGRYPSAFVITKSGRASVAWRKDASFASRGYSAALAGGPRLVRDGKVDIDPIADGFSKRALEIIATRSGVGVTKSGNIVLVVEGDPMTLADFAERMRAQGCDEAMNLDGGPACGLYFRGRTLSEATLPMTNLLVFYEKH